MLNPLNLISKLIKSPNQKQLDQSGKIVSKINELEHHHFPLVIEKLLQKDS